MNESKSQAGIMEKYSIIYADPPWTFKTYSDKGKGRSAEQHYHCMTKEDIQALDVQSICKDDAVLFLWVTYPCLEEGLELIKAWGFKYKTCAFSWVKLNKKSDTPFTGMGYYTRANNEICLLATKGKGLPRVSKAVKQIVIEKIGRHSEKPDTVRHRIVELFGDVKRLEMFARTKSDGWDTWGDEVESDIKIGQK